MNNLLLVFSSSVVKKLLTSTKIDGPFVIDETQSDYKPKAENFDKEVSKN